MNYHDKYFDSDYAEYRTRLSSAAEKYADLEYGHQAPEKCTEKERDMWAKHWNREYHDKMKELVRKNAYRKPI